MFEAFTNLFNGEKKEADVQNAGRRTRRRRRGRKCRGGGPMVGEGLQTEAAAAEMEGGRRRRGRKSRKSRRGSRKHTRRHRR